MTRRRITGPQPFDMSAEQDAKATAMIVQAEEDIAEAEQRVNMRLGRPQLDVIKRAAKVYGVPYQTYLKEAAFRQAISDLHQAEDILGKQASVMLPDLKAPPGLQRAFNELMSEVQKQCADLTRKPGLERAG